MKKIIMLTLSLLTAPLYASLDCMDNSEHLQYGDYDNKEWHSVECDCPCTYVKGRKCVECGHLQKARPWTIVQTSAIKAVQQNSVRGPQTVTEALNNLVKRYVYNKE
jgi:hypothetical protein